MGRVGFQIPLNDCVTEPHLYVIENQRFYEVDLGKPFWYPPVMAGPFDKIREAKSAEDSSGPLHPDG